MVYQLISLRARNATCGLTKRRLSEGCRLGKLLTTVFSAHSHEEEIDVTAEVAAIFATLSLKCRLHNLFKIKRVTAALELPPPNLQQREYPLSTQFHPLSGLKWLSNSEPLCTRLSFTQLRQVRPYFAPRLFVKVNLS